MQKNYLKPLDQLFSLNAEIHPELDKYSGPIIVVGGQAVAYWLNYYSDIIKPTLDSERASQSVDIDYAAYSADVQDMADCWNVIVSYAKDHPPPSIALMKLEDSNKVIKQNLDGFLFIDIDELDYKDIIKSNLVDIIDRPAGFPSNLLSSKKDLRLFTAEFQFPLNFGLSPHSKLRILSPLGCIKSRIANLFQTQKNKDIEVARIKLLREPLAYYLQDFAAENGFKEFKVHLDSFKDLILSDNGCKLYTIHDVNLIEVYKFLATKTPNMPNLFIEKELPSVLLKMNEKYKKRKTARINYLSKD